MYKRAIEINHIQQNKNLLNYKTPFEMRLWKIWFKSLLMRNSVPNLHNYNLKSLYTNDKVSKVSFSLWPPWKLAATTHSTLAAPCYFQNKFLNFTFFTTGSPVNSWENYSCEKEFTGGSDRFRTWKSLIFLK